VNDALMAGSPPFGDGRLVMMEKAVVAAVTAIAPALSDG
jgi:hypothetical protein